MKGTSKEQMSALLRKAQQLQAMAMGYVGVHIDTYLSDDEDAWFTVYITEPSNCKPRAYKYIYAFYSYEENCNKIKEIKDIIMSRIEL
jgi:hypothetical protein